MKTCLFLLSFCATLSLSAQSFAAFKPRTWAPGNVVLRSADGRDELNYQVNGNLALYKNKTKAIWSSGSSGRTPVRLSFQPDGNLVLYGYNPAVVWSAGCYRGAKIPLDDFMKGMRTKEGSRLALQNDGNLVVYSVENRAVWSSGTWEKND